MVFNQFCISYHTLYVCFSQPMVIHMKWLTRGYIVFCALVGKNLEVFPIPFFCSAPSEMHVRQVSKYLMAKGVTCDLIGKIYDGVKALKYWSEKYFCFFKRQSCFKYHKYQNTKSWEAIRRHPISHLTLSHHVSIIFLFMCMTMIHFQIYLLT